MDAMAGQLLVSKQRYYEQKRLTATLSRDVSRDMRPAATIIRDVTPNVCLSLYHILG